MSGAGLVAAVLGLELDTCELGSDWISAAEVEGPESVEPRLLLLSVF